jgi:hypothetical protein
VLLLHERRRDLQNGNALGAIAALQRARDVEAVNVGKIDIEQDEVGPVGRRGAQRFRAGRGLEHFEAVLPQRARVGIPQRCVVVDDEDTRRGHGRSEDLRLLRHPPKPFKNSGLESQESVCQYQHRRTSRNC